MMDITECCVTLTQSTHSMGRRAKRGGRREKKSRLDVSFMCYTTCAPPVGQQAERGGFRCFFFVGQVSHIKTCCY